MQASPVMQRVTFMGTPVGFLWDGNQFLYSSHGWDMTGKKSTRTGSTGIIMTIGQFFYINNTGAAVHREVREVGS